MKPLVEEIQRRTGLGGEDAYRFHLEMWMFVHGIAAMVATSYLNWDTETISSVLTDAFFGLKHRFSEEGRKDK